jgi:signal transduction histidine kinase
MIRMRNYIAFIYALFICLAVFVLSLVINAFAGKLFSEYITDNIQVQNEEIIRTFTDQYDPFMMNYNISSIDAIGMHYLHQGYLVSLEDTRGGTIWDVHDMDMEECAAIVDEITTRMNNEYRLSGSFTVRRYGLKQGARDIGVLNIASYGPFFYRENEAVFLKTLNRFLLGAGSVFVFLSVVVSIGLAAAIAKPVLRARDAARNIAGGDFTVRVPERYAARELHELSRSVNDLARALEKGEQWQKRLSSDIAHELRTPLTTLQGTIEAMLDGIWEPTPERLENCHEEILRLYKLVEDLNQLSIIERDAIVLKKSNGDVSRLLSQAVGRFLPLAREKGISLTADLVPAPLYADHDRLMQVFVNLLSNAVKYTATGTVAVTLRPAGDAAASGEHGAGSHYEITVADTGIGIGAEDLPHIFERLYRSDKSRSRETGGAGIGLSIAAAIVAAHGGTISVERNAAASGAASGSVFRVVL